MATSGERLDFLVIGKDDRITTTDVVLDRVSYQFLAQHRPWDDSWMLSQFTASGTPIVQGALANVGEDILSNVVVPERPPGRLVIVDTLGKDRDPGLGDWRSGVWLVYFPASS